MTANFQRPDSVCSVFVSGGRAIGNQWQYRFKFAAPVICPCVGELTLPFQRLCMCCGDPHWVRDQRWDFGSKVRSRSVAERQTQERHSDMPRYSKLLGKKTTALSFVKIYTANKEGRNNIVPLIRKEEQFVCKAYSAHYFTAEIPSSTHHPPACGQTPPITLLLEYLAPPITHQHVDRLRPLVHYWNT